MWYAPGKNFGYTLKKIDDHPWNTLLTMREVVQLEPGSIEFTGPDAERHREFWLRENPGLFFTPGQKPVFVLDTTPVHPHSVETKPRQPYMPWNIRKNK
jgi:hypothetical protein